MPPLPGSIHKREGRDVYLKQHPCRGSLRHFRTSPTVCSTNACLYSTLPTSGKRGRFRIHKSPTETRTFPVPQQAWMRFSKKSPLQHPGTYKKTVAHSRNTGFRACGKTSILSSVGTQSVDKVISCRFKHYVIPAEAEIQTFISQCYAVLWIPTYAGMTSVRHSCIFTKLGFVNSLSSVGTVV